MDQAPRTVRPPPLVAVFLPILVLLLLVGLPAPTLEAQTFRGLVVSDATGEPIRQASVQVRNVDDPDRIAGGTTTDRDGEFTVWVRTAGNYTIRVEALGYGELTTDTLSLAADEVKSVEIRLDVDAVDIEAIEVTGQRREPAFMRGVRERSRAGFGTVYTREDLEFRMGAQVADILRTQPGMTVLNRLGQDGQVGIQTGRAPPGAARECFAAVYRDGVRVYDASMDLTDSVWEVLNLGADQIEAIEVYRGVAQVPMEYSGVGAECGVVAVWTRQDIDPFSPSRQDMQYRIRFALEGGAAAYDGHLAPSGGPGIKGSMHVSVRDRLALGAVVGLGFHDLSGVTLAEFSSLVSSSATLTQGSVRVYSLAVEPRFEFRPGNRVQPVVEGRFSVARRSAQLGSDGNRGVVSSSSSGWGIGAGAGILMNVTSSVGILGTLDVDRVSFGPYRDLRVDTEGTWTNMGIGIGATWSVSPLTEGF
ncbi:MAG: hypothetical protein EA352_01295 [Gemmatimonadales bacterium]|nr:MAG: hypothetical protein EA352_01295 [Gemmatimonadales bacterium]